MEHGNPLCRGDWRSFKVESKDRADQSGAELIAHNYERGKDKYTAFVEKLKIEKKCNYTDFFTTTAK